MCVCVYAWWRVSKSSGFKSEEWSGVENTGVRRGEQSQRRSRRTEEERTRNEEAETPTVHVYTVFSNSTVFCDVCGVGDVKRMRR